jgi:cephalosporin hydroxylase
MKITINTDNNELLIDSNSEKKSLSLYSKEAFEVISREWIRIGWNQKYPYTFSWMGRPIIQLPEDMIRTQEVIYRLKPDVIIETGIAHGGSLIFYSSICKAIGKGKVIGIDIDIRNHNRVAIEEHEMYQYITMLEGSSVSQEIVDKVYAQIQKDDVVMMILDSNHSKAHVLAELEAYCDLIKPGSYIVATDGVMFDVNDVPRADKSWISDNPIEAVKEFLQTHNEFRLEQPNWPFNESSLDKNITHWPSAWLKRLG